MPVVKASYFQKGGVRMLNKKTMIYLDPDTHDRLRRLAFEEEVSMAERIRRAV
jgi:hypothetical protein